MPFEVLDRKGCVAAEPGLAPAQEKIIGGLRLPGDETGDCYKFINALSQQCERLGVSFRYGVNISALKEDRGRVTAIKTSSGDIAGDLFVAALGSYTPALLRPLGLRLPISPVKGYSITLPIVNKTRAPVSTVMDETYKVAITRLGTRIRVGGMAEIAGFNHDLPDARYRTLCHSVKDLFGGAGDEALASLWTGLRPMTPDGTPIIGATRYSNLYLNAGHGTLGWNMACGSAALLADLVSGRSPTIRADDLNMFRYQ